MPHFALVTIDGDALAPIELSRAWRAISVRSIGIPTGARGPSPDDAA